MIEVILINGPAQSGKDTAGRLIKENYRNGNVTIVKFAEELKVRTHALYGLYDYNDDGALLPKLHDAYEDVKDKPHADFLGLTPRQAYIEVSENHFKRLYGKRIFGELLLTKIQNTVKDWGDQNLVVVTDSGFREEAEVLTERYRTKLIRLQREGYGFANDSRNYIDLSDIGVPTYDIESPSGDMDGFLKNLGAAINWLEPRYTVEVQIPMASSLDWYQQGKPRASIDLALAAVEELRQTGYRMRIFRIKCNGNVVKLVMPEDAPVAEIAKSRSGD